MADLEARSVRRSTTPDGAPRARSTSPRCAPRRSRCGARCCGRVMSEVAGRRPIAFDHVDAALRLMDEQSRRALDLPGQRLERIGSSVVLTGRVAGAEGRARRSSCEPFPFSAVYPRRGGAARRRLGRLGGKRPACNREQRRLPERRARAIRPLPRKFGRTKSSSGRPISASRARWAEEAAGLFRGPESRAEPARRGAAGGRRERSDCLGGGLRNRRGFSGNGPRARRDNLET